MKKIIKIFFFIMFICIAFLLIIIGLYLEKISKPSYLYKTGINIFKESIDNFIKIDEKYILGDNFFINGEVNIELDSEEYSKKARDDEEYRKKLNVIKNLNKMDITYNISQSRDANQLYLELNENIDKENIFLGKYFVDNSTEYYFVQGIVKNYVNAGSNNYFEAFNKSDATKSNIDYLYNFILGSLAVELGNNSEKYEESTNISNNNVDVRKVSVKLTDKIIRDILNGILEDLKNDEEAYKILSSINSNFSKSKVSSKYKFLDNDESYTINIYSSKTLSKPLKYEIVYMNGDSTKMYSYEGDSKKGKFYYLENSDVLYTADISINSKKIIIYVFNRLGENAGSIKVEKDINNLRGNLLLNLDDKKYNIVLSSKYKDYVKNKSYTNEIAISFKAVNTLVTELSGDIKINSVISKDANIEEDTSDSILKSTLGNIENNKMNSLYDDILARLEK